MQQKCSKQLRWECPSCIPNVKLETPRLHSSAASDRPETNELPKLPPIPEVVWQQPTETITDQDNLNFTNNDWTSKTTGLNQTSPPKGTRLQNYVATPEHHLGNPTGNQPVPFLNCSKNCPTDIEKAEQHVTTTHNGDTTTPPLTTATPLIEQALKRGEQTIEVHLSFTCTLVLKRNQAMPYVPLDFGNNIMVDALVDSGAFVGAIAQNDVDTVTHKAPNNFLKIDDPPNFQTQVANGQLQKPLSTAPLKVKIGDITFAEHFVVTWPLFGLHFMRNSSVVLDTTYGLIFFPHFTMQVKTSSSGTNAKPEPLITVYALSIPPTTTKTIKAFVDHPSKWNTTGTVTPLQKFTDRASLLISQSKSIIIDKRLALRVTNTTESPYLIKKHTQIAELSAVTPEQ